MVFSYKRRKSHEVMVGDVGVGGGNPVRVQSMTDTLTSDVNATVAQIKALVNAGSEIVRITVNDKQAAIAVPKIIDKLQSDNYSVPIVGDFHYNGHTLLTEHQDCAASLDKYRINPGNVGFNSKQDKQFCMMVEAAMLHNKPIRIGVNWGSLDEAMLAKLMDENAKLKNPLAAEEVMKQALVESALASAKRAVELGLPENRIVISCKVSKCRDLIEVYRELAKKSSYCLHLGLTEAGMGAKGIVASSAAMGTLLLEGIGDTIRVSLTPEVGGHRSNEVLVACTLLQSLEIRNFAPQVTSCPGCGRTSSSFFRELAADINQYIKVEMPNWKIKFPGVEKLNIAVMGCIVNGPGESKHADIGISLPGNGESPVAPVFIDGQKIATLRGDNIANEFKELLYDYINKKFG